MGTLRVISGSAKGLRLKTVPGDTTRPITDLVKESLFNILGDTIEDATILDLFGGTGAVGIEALSRGAEFVTFIDNSYRAVKIIKENLTTTDLSDYAEVFKRDAFDFLRSNPERQYDIIYVAPPQYKKMWLIALEIIDTKPDLLTKDGTIIVQINPLEWEIVTLQSLTESHQRKYGDTSLFFFIRSQ
ncbi:MAG: 16S rRNA (guanine(966)-N(2))-methyltransferase RsmD [Anaerolineaceae bacterium]|nr:16S rRNA (guanine(966)-N(2))-methyltransferase RsmD [Anaerolineaceae bacterium]